MKKTKTVIFTSLKGGTGKSMTVFNLLGCLSQRGYKVCGIDADPQSNLTKSMTSKQQQNGLYELLTDECSINDVLLQPYEQNESLKNIYLIPSNYNLFLYEKDSNSKNQIYDLKNKLESLSDFDYIIVDSNPSLSFILTSAYAYVDYYMSVFDMSMDALDGFEFLEKSIISNIQKTVNPNLEFRGIVLNNKKGATSFNTQFINAVLKRYGDFVFNPVISDLVANKEARAFGQPTIDYDPRHQAASQYNELTDEFIRMLER